MKPGSVIVDVAIDQGGCFETSHATTHADPVYVVDGVTHYCVANMPGGVPRTSTFALNNATLPFVLALADKGWKKALADDPHLHERTQRRVRQGHLPAGGEALGLRVHRGRRAERRCSRTPAVLARIDRVNPADTAGSHNASCGNASSSSRPTTCSTMNCIIPA